MARWVRRRVPAGRVLAIANQKRGVLPRYGLTREEADRAAWTIERDGRRSQGAAAVNRVMREVGGPWSLLAAPYRLRPLAALEEAVYRWFARHRSGFHRLGVRPECDEPGSDCE
ncbi:MAG TPA: DCC1-like thiol-disulfide oxidoreductase family protein [Candidatus Dormibacteraeota bacterium]|nr:DCC1-like thiol-disulfide oxidoreductase family protein [Candidatus Dormibacteraeota bacterium]